MHAPPYGYTLVLVRPGERIQLDALQASSTSISSETSLRSRALAAALVMVVNPLVPAKTVLEFIVYAKANPGKINMASSGNGSVSHVFGELFKMMAGVELVHVPYRGGYVSDLLGGQTQVVFGDDRLVHPTHRRRRLRALAVTTATRSPALPDVPAVGEFCRATRRANGTASVLPGRHPAEIVSKLNSEINAGLADPQL